MWVRVVGTSRQVLKVQVDESCRGRIWRDRLVGGLAMIAMNVGLGVVWKVDLRVDVR